MVVIVIGLEAVLGVLLEIVLDLEPDFGRVIGLPIEVEVEVTMSLLNPPVSLPIPIQL